MALGIFRDAMRQFIYIRMKEILRAGNVVIRIKEAFLAEQAELDAFTDQEGRSLSERFEESIRLIGGATANALEIDIFHALANANRPYLAATFPNFDQGKFSFSSSARKGETSFSTPTFLYAS